MLARSRRGVADRRTALDGRACCSQDSNVRLRIAILLLTAAALFPPAALASVSWGGRTFTDRHQLCAWLEDRGARCDFWSVRHPYAWQQLAAQRHRPPAPRAAAPLTDGGGPGLGLELVLAAAAATALGFGVAASTRLPVSRDALTQGWFVAAALTLAVLIGVGVTRLLS